MLLAPLNDLKKALHDSNAIRTQYHLVRKRTLNHLAKLTKWLSCVVSTYLYCTFDWQSKGLTTAQFFKIKTCNFLNVAVTNYKNFLIKFGNSSIAAVSRYCWGIIIRKQLSVVQVFGLLLWFWAGMRLVLRFEVRMLVWWC